MSAAYGIFYQKPENQQLFFTTNLGYTKATHYIINYQKSTTDRIFRVEAFYKKYDDLIKSYPVNYNYYVITTITEVVMQKELNFFGEIKKASKILITG